MRIRLRNISDTNSMWPRVHSIYLSIYTYIYIYTYSICIQPHFTLSHTLAHTHTHTHTLCKYTHAILMDVCDKIRRKKKTENQ